MNGMRKVFGFLILMAFAAFALPAAAQKVVKDDLNFWLPIIKASGASAE